MTNEVYDDVPVEERRVCHECIGEPYLTELITQEGDTAACYYCGDEGVTITIDALSDHVEGAIERHYARTSSVPEGYDYYVQRETGNWSRAGYPISELISDLLAAAENICEELAQDVREVLSERTSDIDIDGEEQPFDEEAHYEMATRVEHWELSEQYSYFEKLITEQARFFSPEARGILNEMFSGLEAMEAAGGRSVLVEAGPERAITRFFRARVFQDDEQFKEALSFPDRKLAPPPPRRGRAGRLNAAGVSTFYGANLAAVALAEVRPPVGSRVLMAQFELTRVVRLLDLDALQSLLVKGSLFDPEHLGRLQRAAFLSSFSARFTRPIMPDHEEFEYIPTQAIADFLAHEIKPPLDGILYASAQSAVAGINVALFHKASRVEAVQAPQGMTSDVMFGHITEEGDEEDDYTVFEEVPPASTETAEATRPALTLDNWDFGGDPDMREPALRIDMSSLRVHRVRPVAVDDVSYPVMRIRQVQGDSDF